MEIKHPWWRSRKADALHDQLPCDAPSNVGARTSAACGRLRGFSAPRGWKSVGARCEAMGQIMEVSWVFQGKRDVCHFT